MSGASELPAPLKRIPSGIPGLDRVLHGGFLEGGAYIVKGLPGAGKTILVNHVCFNHVAAGGRALYVTLLSEAHARLLQHMRQFDFFAAAPISERLVFISGFSALETGGLDSVLALLRGELLRHEASLLVIDGLLALGDHELSDRALRKFVHQLQMLMSSAACTGLITTGEGRALYHPEYTMVDGVLTLENPTFGTRTQRQLHVDKFRGTDYLGGQHPFTISKAGISVFPRLESWAATSPASKVKRIDRLGSGIRTLDRLMNGGIPSGTTTLVLGPSGVGKTMTGLHFVCKSSAQEPALFFTFYETPARLLTKAKRVGLDFEKKLRRGHLEVIWQAPGDNILDAVAARILDAVTRRRVKRVFIDGMGGFQQAVLYPERLPEFFSVFAHALRERGATTILTGETRVLIGSEVRSPIPTLSILAENMLLMRYVELRSKLYRIISILKMRDSDFDQSLYEFIVSPDGIQLAASPDSAEDILAAVHELRHLAVTDTVSPSRKRARRGGASGGRKRR
ncbi:MAG: recombinase RecA [Alphaproteobacteria bacterium]|nr:recombinase RecA [Alphaproteobacteria bacterium]